MSHTPSQLVTHEPQREADRPLQRPVVRERSLWRSLRGKILVRALVIAVVPLVLIGSITIGSLLGLSRSAGQTLDDERQQLGRDVAGRRLNTEAVAVAQELDGLLHERIADVTGWASDPTITDAAAAAAERSQPYAANTNDDLEAAFSDSKMIEPNASARAFLETRLEREPAITSAVFTERNGFNVTGVDEPDDFVQRDEPWWQAAQIRGLHFGAIEYDAVQDRHSLPISARVKNPSNGEGFGGVLQARLGLELLQDAASRNAGEEGREVTILSPDGTLLAETASDHDPERIMQPGVTFEGARADAVRRAVDATAPDAIVLDDLVAGYAPLSAVRDRPGGTASDISAFRGIDSRPIDWVVMVEQPSQLAFAQLDGLSAVQQGLNDTATRLAFIGAVLLVAAIAVAAFVSSELSRRIVAPLRSLRRSAYDVAERQLPQLIDHVHVADDDDELPSVPPVEVHTDDEVEDVAQAFNVVRDTAIDLAAEQARSRRNTSTMFVNLGRRNQALLSRQLEFIDDLESQESNPELLDNLFRLDHLATRMRRNAESLLVLAGEQPSRRWTQPVALTEVVRGAVAEVEDYHRVDLADVEEAELTGSAVADVSHLLAELLENASRFSPPDSQVVVVGRHVAEGYALAIVDSGVGMDDEQLAAANERIASSPQIQRVPASYLGLFVVGRLAARHDITVRLVESTTEGVTAKVLLPVALVESPQHEPQPSEHGAASPQRMPARALPASVTARSREPAYATSGASSTATRPDGHESEPYDGTSTPVADTTTDLPGLGVARRRSTRGGDDGDDQADSESTDRFARVRRDDGPAGAIPGDAALEVRRRPSRLDAVEAPATATGADDRAVLRAESRAGGVNAWADRADPEGPGPGDMASTASAVPRIGPVPDDDRGVDHEPRTVQPASMRARRNATATRERLTRFQRAIRQGRAQTGTSTPPADNDDGAHRDA